LLEIVGCSDSHGTHVAAIASAFFPCNPLLNGLAPGAQIVSLTIGDNRLGCQESGVAIMRAMGRVLRCQGPTIDVINMSYGELTHWAPDGSVSHESK
jgi:tripeptidyl-peptidase-2